MRRLLCHRFGLFSLAHLPEDGRHNDRPASINHSDSTEAEPLNALRCKIAEDSLFAVDLQSKIALGAQYLGLAEPLLAPTAP